MTLDEAIKHCKEKASGECSECAKEHYQLMEWLVDYKRLRKMEKEIISVIFK